MNCHSVDLGVAQTWSDVRGLLQGAAASAKTVGPGQSYSGELQWRGATFRVGYRAPSALASRGGSIGLTLSRLAFGHANVDVNDAKTHPGDVLLAVSWNPLPLQDHGPIAWVCHLLFGLPATHLLLRPMVSDEWHAALRNIGIDRGSTTAPAAVA